MARLWGLLLPGLSGRRAAGAARRRVGTTGRLLAVHGAALTVILAVVLAEVVRDFSDHYQRTLVADLGEEAPEYAQAASARPAGQGLQAFSRSYLESHLLPAGHVLVVGLVHQPALGSAGATAVAASPVVAAWLAHPPLRSTERIIALPGGSDLAVATPIMADGKTVGVLVSAGSLAGLQSQTGQVALVGGVEAAVALLASLAGAFVLLRRVLRTVAAVTDAALQAGAGDLDRRLGEDHAGDEVGRLTSAFDVMLGRISDGVQAQRRLLSDVSHQLRTPLTVASGHLEVLRRSGGGNPEEVTETTGLVLDELRGMAALVDRLLLLGRALEPDFIEVDRVDLRSFMTDIFEAAKVLADRRWSLAPVPDVVALVDQGKLRGALLNLIDNAVKATQPGQAIEVSARCQAELTLAVADWGRGIPPQAQKEVFDRFRQGLADGQRSADGQRGAGLGLAIVKAVAGAHGGQVRLDSTPGAGTTVSIVLPASCLEPPGGPGGALCGS